MNISKMYQLKNLTSICIKMNNIMKNEITISEINQKNMSQILGKSNETNLTRRIFVRNNK